MTVDSYIGLPSADPVAVSPAWGGLVLIQRPLLAAAIFSIAWSIVKEAAF
jgi:hypothetical protein